MSKMNIVKKNLIFSIAILVVGIVMISVFALGLVPENYNESMVIGMGFGLTSSGLYSTFRLSKTIKDNDEVEEQDLIMNDERNVWLRDKAGAKVYSIFSYVDCIIIFIAGVLGYRAISLLFAVLVIAKLMVWYFACVNLSKKY